MAEQLGTLARTHTCGALRPADVGQQAVLLGWVHRVRDLGALVFIDVRDRHGLTQVIVEGSEALLERAKRLRSEFVVAILGEVERRSPDTVNLNVPTGEVEVRASEIRILNEAKTPPFSIAEDQNVSEETRLRYRYLDLRRPTLQRNIGLRHRITMAIRRYFDEQGFYEIETPILTKSTPEGARDFLVPSRVHPGEFYALPQSPQIFKQILMIAGFDRYVQIARCFRDEALRADRQLEFTQVDLEMSFATPPLVFEIVEGALAACFREIGVEIPRPLRMPRRPCVPDPQARPAPPGDPGLRGRVAESPFGIFREQGRRWMRLCHLARPALEAGSGSPVGRPSAAATGRLRPKECSRPQGWAAGTRRVLVALAPARDLRCRLGRTGAVSKVWGLRLQVQTVTHSREVGTVRVTSAVDWWDEKRWDSVNHPFTAPRDEDLLRLESDPGSVLAKAYDVILNGWELGGGSIRIHDRETQARVFRLLGMSDEDAKNRFGFFLESLEYGTPPHGGLALGLDRICALLSGETSIREVIPFPKTTQAVDLMCDAPSTVDPRQLRELSIKIQS
jgi:aspartyl-tRNA synthetase